MITEEQRRALFALREALNLCHNSGVEIYQGVGCVIVSDDDCRWQSISETGDLTAGDVDALLAEHPE